MRIGVDIGGSHVGVGLLNERGTFLAKRERDLNNIEKKEEYSEILVETIIDLITQSLEEKNINITDIELIGIAVPGIVSDTHIIKAENLKEKDTLSYINNAFRDGEIKTFGVDFDKLLPPISRFSREENRQEKKNSIADKLIRFFEKFYNISWIIDIYKKTIDILQITGILLIRNFNLIYKGASYGYFRR